MSKSLITTKQAELRRWRIIKVKITKNKKTAKLRRWRIIKVKITNNNKASRIKKMKDNKSQNH